MKATRRAAILAAVGAGALAIAGIGGAYAKSTVNLWSFIDPQDTSVRATTLAHVISEFEKANPEIDVNTTVIQWDQIPQVLLRADQAGNVPDLVMIYSPSMPAMIASGALSPLDDKLSQLSEEDKKDVIILPIAQRDGQTYGVPWEIRIIGFVYNNKMLRDAGLQVPKTLDELGTFGGKLTQGGVTGVALGFDPADPSGGMEWFIGTLAGLGGKLINPDGTAAFNSTEGLELVNYVHDLVHKYKAVPVDVALSGDEAVQQMVEAGRAAFVSTGTHRVSLIREKTGLGVDIGFMPLPGKTAEKPSPALIQGWNLAIPARAANKDDAWRLLQHWTSAEMQTYQVEKAGYMPVRASVTSGAALAGDENNFLRESIQYAKDSPLQVQWPENTDALFGVLSRMMSSVVEDQQTPEQALKAAEEEYNRLVKK